MPQTFFNPPSHHCLLWFAFLLCYALKGMPISFSVCCNISFVTRNGVGDGDGEGSGVAVGDGVWANALIGRCGATIIAVPRAGTSLTNERRSKVLDPFAVRSFDSDLVPGFLDMGFSVSLTRPSFMVGQGSTHSLGPWASRPHAASPDMLSGRGVRASRSMWAGRPRSQY